MKRRLMLYDNTFLSKSQEKNNKKGLIAKVQALSSDSQPATQRAEGSRSLSVFFAFDFCLVWRKSRRILAQKS